VTADPNAYIRSTAVHTNGTVFSVIGDAVVGVDPKTGNPQFSVPMEHTTWNTNGVGGDSPPLSTSLIIAGDGNAYVAYAYQNSVETSTATTHTRHADVNLKVLQVAPDGSFRSMQIATD
jgi:hypothetical protein